MGEQKQKVKAAEVSCTTVWRFTGEKVMADVRNQEHYREHDGKKHNFFVCFKVAITHNQEPCNEQ